MKTLTFEEMKERFPVVWQWRPWQDGGIFVETFCTKESIGHICETQLECLNKTLDEASQKYKREIERVNEYARTLKERLGILYWFKKKFQKAYKNQLQELENEWAQISVKIAKSEIKHLCRKSNYYLPFDCRIGDVFWIVVERDNLLPRGVHKSVVSSVERYFSEETLMVKVSAKALTSGNSEVILKLSGDGVVCDGWSFHHIFTSHQEAVEAMSTFIQRDIDELNKLKEKIESY